MIKKILKNKKGAVENVHFVILSIAFLTIFLFLIDVMLFTRTYIGMSNFLEGITRSISIQGSVFSSTPNKFPGGADMYFTKDEIKTNLLNAAKKYKLDERNISMFVQSIKSNTLKTSPQSYDYIIKSYNTSFVPKNGTLATNNVWIDYGQPIKTGLNYAYKTILGGVNIQVKIYKNGISEYKHSTNSWNY